MGDSSADITGRLGLVNIRTVVNRNRLKWFGRAERKEGEETGRRQP